MVAFPLLFLFISAAVTASKGTAADSLPNDDQASFTDNARDALETVKESLNEATDTASETANSAYSSVLSSLLTSDPPNCEDLEKDRERKACEKARDQYSVVFV